MKITFKKIVSFTLAAAMAVGAAFTLASCGKKDSETLKIGVSAPLTGVAAQYGIAVRNSAQLAIDEINAMEDNGLGMKFGPLNLYLFLTLSLIANASKPCPSLTYKYPFPLLRVLK